MQSEKKIKTWKAVEGTLVTVQAASLGKVTTDNYLKDLCLSVYNMNTVLKTNRSQNNINRLMYVHSHHMGLSCNF